MGDEELTSKPSMVGDSVGGSCSVASSDVD